MRAPLCRWAELGAEGWDYESCLPYFQALESYEAGNASHRGMDGPIRVTEVDADLPLVKTVLKAVSKAYKLKPSADYNDRDKGDVVGVTQQNNVNNKREDAFSRLVEPLLANANYRLTVAANAMVSHVKMIDNRAVGIMYEHENVLFTVRARNEVRACVRARRHVCLCGESTGGIAGFDGIPCGCQWLRYCLPVAPSRRPRC